MSMLAEPRRKQRISVDPQNLQWGNDESRVGKSMMEKMGWRGGGLGKMENGRRENLKLTANYTQKGLGADKNTADANWIAHNDDFARILAELNQKKNKGNNKEEEVQTKSKKKAKNASNSLEECSQNSSRGARNRYRCKRTKDVKGYTAEQKAGIFGCANVTNNANTTNNDQKKLELAANEVVEEKPERKKKRKKNKKIKVDEEEAEQTIDEDKLLINNAGDDHIKTVPMTMDQYFAQKMAEKLKKRKIGVEESTKMGDEEKMEKKMKCKKKFTC